MISAVVSAQPLVRSTTPVRNADGTSATTNKRRACSDVSVLTFLAALLLGPKYQRLLVSPR